VKISPEYIAQNRLLHEQGTFGMSGGRWAQPVLALCEQLKTRDILDYGCGQRTLERFLGFAIRNYDPCIPGLDAPPEPADIVVCTDVLEHVEPDCLDEVLDDLRRVTRDAGLFLIATRPAERVLADGRNAHLIQQPKSWWLPQLEQRFRVTQVRDLPGEFAVIVRKLAPG
jgi:methyltransferase family protein